jgi:hypothetical protein
LADFFFSSASRNFALGSELLSFANSLNLYSHLFSIKPELQIVYIADAHQEFLLL